MDLGMLTILAGLFFAGHLIGGHLPGVASVSMAQLTAIWETL